MPHKKNHNYRKFSTF